eukprot:1331733-Amorphochlora_amoeboformis.AAC.1
MSLCLMNVNRASNLPASGNPTVAPNLAPPAPLHAPRNPLNAPRNLGNPRGVPPGFLQPCKDFIRGACMRGAGCKYSHDLSINQV